MNGKAGKTEIQKAIEEGRLTFSLPEQDKHEKANRKFFKNLRFKIVNLWK